jgi:alkylated DNA repair dioxygenase AlkB
MSDLFAPAPTENLLPYDGIVNDLGLVLDSPKQLYEELYNDLPWQADVVSLFGKTHVTTRQIVWMGEPDISYYYSGHSRQAIAWSAAVFHVKQCVEQQLADIGITANFNSCLLNYYPTGSDGMGYHADNEKELGPNPIIAALSLGATRKFVFKHKKTQDKVALHLESGQLIVMSGATQRYWKHTVTKTKTVAAGRISLTFRQMYPS